MKKLSKEKRIQITKAIKKIHKIIDSEEESNKKFLKIKKQLIKELKELLDLMIFDSPIYNQFMKYDRVMDLYRLELIK